MKLLLTRSLLIALALVVVAAKEINLIGTERRPTVTDRSGYHHGHQGHVDGHHHDVDGHRHDVDGHHHDVDRHHHDVDGTDGKQHDADGHNHGIDGKQHDVNGHHHGFVKYYDGQEGGHHHHRRRRFCQYFQDLAVRTTTCKHEPMAPRCRDKSTATCVAGTDYTRTVSCGDTCYEFTKNLPTCTCVDGQRVRTSYCPVGICNCPSDNTATRVSVSTVPCPTKVSAAVVVSP